MIARGREQYTGTVQQEVREGVFSDCVWQVVPSRLVPSCMDTWGDLDAAESPG